MIWIEHQEEADGSHSHEAEDVTWWNNPIASMGLVYLYLHFWVVATQICFDVHPPNFEGRCSPILTVAYLRNRGFKKKTPASYTPPKINMEPENDGF